MKRMSIIIICGLLAFNFTSCCTKVGCLGAYYKEIIIVLRGVGFHSSVEEYDKNSGQLVLPNRVNMNFLQYNVIRIGDNYAPHPDSFFLNQRYFIIHTPSETDTIENINYQSNHHTVNCNHCPGDHQLVTDIANFSFTFRGHSYTEKDTIFITQ